MEIHRKGVRLASALKRLLVSTASVQSDTEFSPEYQQRLQSERSQFQDPAVQDLPPIFHYWSNKYVRPMFEEYGFTLAEQVYAKYLGISAKNCPSTTPLFLSVGAGNCDTEVRVAQMLRAAGVSRFVIECLDLNPVMLERGRNLATEVGVRNHLAFIEGDFNNWRATTQYSAVIANQSLHHVLELERLLDEIKRCLRSDGYFVSSDMIGRNGHQRWPEALREVQRFWRELPNEYRWNKTFNRHEEEYINHDCSTEGFEGIRAQDILPLLLTRFDFHLFIGHGNVINVFVDRVFGPNFDAGGEWDRKFIDRVHMFDEEVILSGALPPTQMLAVMTPVPCAEHYYSRGLSPASCVRKPNAFDSNDCDPLDERGERPLSIGTTSLRPLHAGGRVYCQSVAALGGVPPYVWSATGLPPELTVSDRGLLGGMLLSAGVFTPTIMVTDSATTPQTARQRYTIINKDVLPPLTIASPPQLPEGIVGIGHSQRLTATGGKPPYTWSVTRGKLLEGVTLNSSDGVISGKPTEQGTSPFTVQVTDSTAEVATLDMTLAVDQPEISLRRSGILPQVACGAGWKTSVHLVNASPSQVSVSINFWSDDGGPMTLPLTIAQAGKTKSLRANSAREMIAPYSALLIETQVQPGTDLSGWAEVISSSPITGYGVFHYGAATGPQSEAAAGLEVVFESTFILPYVNADGFKTAVALTNVVAWQATSIVATIWDENWNHLGVQTVSLPSGGHVSFMLADRFPITTSKRGIIEFCSRSGSEITGLGLRFAPTGGFTCVPKLVRPPHGGGLGLSG